VVRNSSKRELLAASPVLAGVAVVFIAAVLATPVAAQTIHIPADHPTLQSAIAAVVDGGTIEIAGGAYLAPAAGTQISDVNKRFTVRAAAGANVVLSGGGTRPIVVYRTVNVARRGGVVFEGITFRDGRSTADAIGGAMTLRDAEASFIDCVFEDNTTAVPSTGGGAIFAARNTELHIRGTRFENNVANNAGGAIWLSADSIAYVHDSVFLSNRTNPPGHRNTSAGGAISVVDSTLRLTNSRFFDNQSGFAGGAVYAIGNWVTPVTTPSADVTIANCTFLENFNQPAAGVVPPTATEGGAVHAENQTTIRIYNSRFDKNKSENGGGVNLYRAIVTIDDSVLRGNQANGTGNRGIGGGISIISNDTQADMGVNRRPASLTVRNTFIQGRFDGVGEVGRKGGCVSAIGDSNRHFGGGGISATPNAQLHRAFALLQNVIFDDCDVAVGGGAVHVNLTDLTLEDCLLQRSDTSGTGSSGGGLRVVFEADAKVTNTTFARNSAASFGGALYVQGATIDVDSCQFFDNEVSPGVSEGLFQSNGADMHSGVLLSPAIGATGTIANSVFSNSVGLAISEGDRNDGPINDIRYNGNTFFNNTFAGDIYRNGLAGPATASELDGLVVTRTGAANTAKSQVDSTTAGSAPVMGALLAAPLAIINSVAADDLATSTESFLGFAWSGASATLDGGGVGGAAASTQSTGVGTHTLSVGGTEDYLATVSTGVVANATFQASPMSIAVGEVSTLSWSILAGNFLHQSVDRSVILSGNSAGSRAVTPGGTSTYRMFMVTRQGGVSKDATVFVGENPELIFSDGFEGGNTSQWTLTVP